MRATFIAGPCGGHSHAIGDDEPPELRTHGCPSSSAKDDAKGTYVRVGVRSGVVDIGASTMRDVTFYKWVPDDEGDGHSEVARQ